MALHTALPIYATGGRLLTLAIRIQVQLPRAVKRVLGDQVTTHCIDMLNAMALANAARDRGFTVNASFTQVFRKAATREMDTPQ